VVDEHLESTVPGIFAAGDVANAWHPGYLRYLRVEHWANALNQGLTAGANAAGRRETYDRMPYFFSDQYDLGLEYIGHASPEDAVAIRGDLDSRTFIAFWHRDGWSPRDGGQHVGCRRRSQGIVDTAGSISAVSPRSTFPRGAQAVVEAMTVARMCLHGPRSSPCFPHHGQVHRHVPDEAHSILIGTARDRGGVPVVGQRDRVGGDELTGLCEPAVRSVEGAAAERQLAREPLGASHVVAETPRGRGLHLGAHRVRRCVEQTPLA
jgi:hypothetical protein